MTPPLVEPLAPPSPSIPIPPRLARLPRDRGFVVPWFVAWLEGVPDFRVMDPAKYALAVNARRCWLCGDPLGVYLAFLIGPMCAVNRVSSEPPSHRGCAEYAVRACPLLARPHMRRRETDLPDDVEKPGGEMIARNPGVMLLWMTRSYEVFRDGAGKPLIRVGDPIETHFYAEGRPATRAEVLVSMESGIPLLRTVAARQGPAAIAALATQYDAALVFVPAV